MSMSSVTDKVDARIRKSRVLQGTEAHAAETGGLLEENRKPLPTNRVRHSTIRERMALCFMKRPQYQRRCIMVILVLLAMLVLWEIKVVVQGMLLDPCKVTRDIQLSLSGKDELPRIIHQQWKNDKVPEKYAAYRSKWKELFPEPEYEHMLWTDASARQLLMDHYPWFLPTFDGFKHNIQRADSIRYFILYHHGGLYADLDYQPIANFWAALPKDKASLIESPYKYNEEAQNSMMASPKHDKFWRLTFDIMMERGASESVLVSTGPSMLDEAFSRSKKNGTVYTLLPCENFHRIPFGAAGKGSPIMSRIGREIFGRLPIVKQCGNWEKRDDCQYGIHHNTVSWAQQTIV